MIFMKISHPTTLITGLLCLFSLLAVANDQNHEAIYSAVKHYVQQQLPLDKDHEILLNTLDPRLKLNECLQALEVFTQNTPIKAGRNSIGVRCDAGRSWSLFIPVQIKIFRDVVVVTQALKRGDILSQANVTTQRTDVALLKAGFITNPEEAIGKQVQHNLIQGTPLNNKDLVKATIIKRGDSVIIISENPKMLIQMPGIAMSDAFEGQNIRVKNTSSGRIINANAIKSGVVAVNY